MRLFSIFLLLIVSFQAQSRVCFESKVDLVDKNPTRVNQCYGLKNLFCDGPHKNFILHNSKPYYCKELYSLSNPSKLMSDIDELFLHKNIHEEKLNKLKLISTLLEVRRFNLGIRSHVSSQTGNGFYVSLGRQMSDQDFDKLYESAKLALALKPYTQQVKVEIDPYYLPYYKIDIPCVIRLIQDEEEKVKKFFNIINKDYRNLDFVSEDLDETDRFDHSLGPVIYSGTVKVPINCSKFGRVVEYFSKKWDLFVEQDTGFDR